MSQIPDLSQWQDHGMGGYETGAAPQDWRRYGPGEETYGEPDRFFGAFSERMGVMTGEGLGLAVEATPELLGGQVVARTPMLELTPRDYRYVQVLRKPYPGMQALGDDGAIYEYDGLGGFFKRIFRGVKKVVGKVRKGIRKVVSKIPGGKYLIKLGKKIWKVAKKFVKPLIKFVGKYAAKLAPVAALIPGWGPAIAAGLYTAGKVANLMQKYSVKIKGAVGKVRKLKFKSGKKAKKFKKALEKAAKKEAKRQKRGGKIKKIRGGKRRKGKLTARERAAIAKFPKSMRGKARRMLMKRR